MRTEPRYSHALTARKESIEIGVLIALSLAIQLGLAVAAVREAGIPLSGLAVYFDGHLYLEIARSFPLPYSPLGPDYVGHSPGYPALAWLLHTILPSGFVNWGGALLLASWVPAAMATGMFYLLCRELEIVAFWPSVFFVVGNPRWLLLCATPHAEPLAMLFVIASLIAYYRRSLGWCVFLLSLATLTRYPALLVGLPIAFGTILVRRDWTAKTIAILAIPIAVFALLNLYLYVHLPDFKGIAAAHDVFWVTGPTWPFAALWQNANRAIWPSDYFLFEVTYTFLFGYLSMIALGFRSSDRRIWILSVWVAAIVLFHVSLSGVLGAWDFTRLVVLAWPAALLILWRGLSPRVTNLSAASLCVLAFAFSCWFANGYLPDVLVFQNNAQPFLKEKIRMLDSNRPEWIDFRAQRRE